jgi:glycosyltransferase involved in cell wall biosynthesis
MMMLEQSVAVLIPAYNAEIYLEELISRLRQSIDNMPIVVVDDGSKDRTNEVAASMGIIVLQHEKNRGKGAALETGFEYCRKHPEIELLITMDADLQHRPEDIPGFISMQNESNADIVIGWRERIGTRMPVHRILSNTITSAMVGMRTGMNIKDSQCGFRMIHRRVIEKIHLESTGYEAETEFLIKAARLGFKIEFVPVNTVYGNEKSYMTHWDTTKNFIKVLFRDYA